MAFEAKTVVAGVRSDQELAMPIVHAGYGTMCTADDHFPTGPHSTSLAASIRLKL